MLIKAILLSSLIFTNYAFSEVLDFENKNNLGVTLGGEMTWSDVGGGHLYNEGYDTDDSIFFNGPVYLNDLEMNGLPFEDFVPEGYIGTYNMTVEAWGAGGIIKSVNVDFGTDFSWDEWEKVSFEVGGVTELRFKAPHPTADLGNQNIFWPSVDNVRINETNDAPLNTSALVLLSCLGLACVRRFS